MRFILIAALVFTANMVAGYLGLQLAIPPGFATAIWPPAGVGLASVLIWRTPGLVGVALASMGTNWLHQYGPVLLQPEQLVTPLWIACAAALQALAGAFLIRHFIGYPTRLNRPYDIVRFFLLAGPLGCLISATLSIGYLFISGSMELDAVRINWLTWWVGDTIGVTIFTPLMFLLFAEPRRYWAAQRLSVGVPLLLVVMFTVLMYRQGLEKEYESQNEEFHGRAEAFRLTLQSELNRYSDLLYSLRGFMYADLSAGPEAFRRFARQTIHRGSSLYGISWNQYLPHRERAAFEARMSELYGNIPFLIQQISPQRGLVPAEPREHYVVVTLLEPLAKNQQALGLDLLSSPERRQALERAVSSGTFSISPPIRLVQQPDQPESTGCLIFLPLFHSKSTPDTSGERLDALAGYVTAILQLDKLVASALRRYPLPEHELRLSLVQQGQANAEYYRSANFREPGWLDLTDRSELVLGSDRWLLEQHADRQHLSYSWGLYFVLAGGFFMSALMGGFLLALTGRASDIAQEVRLRTKELQKSNELLAESQRIAQMGSWEWAHGGVPHQWSGEFYRLLGLDSAQKASRELFLQQVSPEEAETVDAALESALRGRRLDLECSLSPRGPGQEARWLSLKGERVILGQGRQGKRYFLSIVARDITEQRNAAQELELAAITFDTHEAILITDADTVIQRVNRAFCRMTGYSSDEVVGRRISLLRSGRHSQSFYNELWQTLLSKGHWHGEIWNKRKDDSVLPCLVTITAVDTLAQGNTTHYVAAFLDITEKKASEERIRYLAYYDSITELPNRDLFLESLRQQLAHSNRHKDYSALMFMDLDNFKMLNDSLGHDMGDELLRAVAARLTDMLRAEDIFSRFGGDEFLFLLPLNQASPQQALDQAAHAASRVLQALEQPFDLNGHSHTVSASIGVTYLPQPEIEAEGYIQQADTAMYRAKGSGKADFAFYEPEMQTEVLRRLELEKSLRTALEEQQFVLFYQPQHDNKGAMVGCEALIRWQHPEQGIIGPGAFIGVAEESSLIIDLGLLVLESACRQMQAWQNSALAECEVSVNISSRHFAHPGFIADIEAVLARYPAAKNRLWLEITEGVFLKGGANLNDTFVRLKALGVRCSIDDFGTGYSSLGYLKNLDIDQIKIAQEFVRDLVDDEKDAQLVKAILQMSLSLGIDLVAEGVETEAQYNYLRELGCPCYQGYLFARPMPADQLLHYCRQL